MKSQPACGRTNVQMRRSVLWELNIGILLEISHYAFTIGVTPHLNPTASPLKVDGLAA
jgi:hypothetical protein